MRITRFRALVGTAVIGLMWSSAAAAQSAPADDQEEAQPAPSAPTPADSPTEDEQGNPVIIVTGTNIRGVAPVGSPIITLGANDFAKTNSPTNSDLLLRLPMVANAGATDRSNVGGLRVQGAGANFTTRRSINLRNLGPGSTLTLFNGQRFTYVQTGEISDADIFPSGLISRMEVVANGGSAIYGADAIAGTVNFVLREPEDTLEFLGRATLRDGGTDWQVQQVMGRVWELGGRPGGFLMAYEHVHNDAIAASHFEGIYDDDLSPYIGPSGALPTFSSPANVLGIVGPAGTTALYAAPTGLGSAQGLLLSQLGAANDPRRQSLWTNTFPIATQNRNTVSAIFKQEVSDSIDAYVIGTFSRRKGAGAVAGATDTSAISVPATNPYSPCAPGVSRANTRGLACPANNTITARYSFARELGPIVNNFTTRFYGGTVGLNIDLFADWAGRISTHYSTARDITQRDNRINTTLLRQVVSGVGKPANIPFFNPFCDNTAGPCNDPATLNYIRGISNISNNPMSLWDSNISADGALFAMPGGDVRLAVGAQYSKIYYQDSAQASYNLTSVFGETSPPVGITAGRKIYGTYAELYIPVFGEANGFTGVRKLEVTLAGRYTYYKDSGDAADSDVGGTFNPKIGLNWSPFNDLRVYGSYGTSFRAPTVSNLNEDSGGGLNINNSLTCGQIVGINLAACPAGVSTPVSAFFFLGGNPDLKPEKATTWSAGFNWTPDSIPRTAFGVNYFRINITDRIRQPAFTAGYLTAVNSGLYDEFLTLSPVFFPTRATMTLAQFNAFAAAQFARVPGPQNTNPLLFVANGRRFNAGTVFTDGFDVTASTDFDLGNSRVRLGAQATYTMSYKTQDVEGAPLIENVNAFGYPPRFRSQVEASWFGKRVSVNTFYNFVNRYHANPEDVPATTPPEFLKIDAYHTLDLAITYDTGDDFPLRDLRNFQVQAAVNNLFDAKPPLLVNGNGSPPILYDPQNADPFGRFFSFRVSKQF